MIAYAIAFDANNHCFALLEAIINPKVFLLAIPGFAFGTSAYAFTGLLERLANDLGVPVAGAGQLQTAFALGCALGGPLLARYTASFDRRALLCAVLLTLGCINLLGVVLTEFVPFLLSRLTAGLVGALVLPVASMIAIAMTEEKDRAAGLAVVIGGNTLAFLAGIPLASVIGDILGWRSTFVFAAALCTVAFLVVLLILPRAGAAPSITSDATRQAFAKTNRVLFSMTLLGFIAIFTSVAFVGPIVTSATGLRGSAIGIIQLCIGVGSIAGILGGIRLARWSIATASTLLFSGIFVSQLIMFSSFFFSGWVIATSALCVSLFVGAASLFALAPVVQTKLAASSGAGALVAFAINGSMIFLGQGLGAALGGLVLGVLPISYLAIAAACVACIGLLLSLRGYSHQDSASRT